MTAAVPVGLQDLRDRVEDYRDRLASLGLAMGALQRQADDLLAAIERDCLELQNARSREATATQAALLQPVAVTVADALAETELAAESSGNDPADDVAADAVAAAPEAPPPAPHAAPTRHDDFNLIKGIDPATAEALAGLGLTTFAELADLYQEDVEEIGAALSDPRRIGRECWIEQAAILAAGHTTAYVRSLRSAEPSAAATEPDAMPARTAIPLGWAPRFAPLQADLLPAAGPDLALPQARAGADIEIQIAEARAAVATSRRGLSRHAARGAGSRARVKSTTLTQHRSVPRAGWKVAMTTAAAFALAGISGAIVANDGLQRELAAHLVRLGTCTVESIPVNEDCAVLAWLSL